MQRARRAGSPPSLQTLGIPVVLSGDVVRGSGAVHGGSPRREGQTVHFYLSGLLGGTARAPGGEASGPEARPGRLSLARAGVTTPEASPQPCF